MSSFPIETACFIMHCCSWRCRVPSSPSPIVHSHSLSLSHTQILKIYTTTTLSSYNKLKLRITPSLQISPSFSLSRTHIYFTIHKRPVPHCHNIISRIDQSHCPLHLDILHKLHLPLDSHRYTINQTWHSSCQ